MTPAGTFNELDVQNEWEENTHTVQFNKYTHSVRSEAERVVDHNLPVCRAYLGPLKDKRFGKQMHIFLHSVETLETTLNQPN